MGQQALNGVFVGSIYALFAVGYTLVFGVLDILNLAHAAVFTLAAFIALALVDARLPLWLALALATVFEAIALQIFGPDISRFPQGTFPDRVIRIGGASASLLQLCIVATSVVLMAVLTLLLARTRLGRQIRAVAESPRAARILGVDVDRAIAMAFFLSSALGGAAGVLFGLAFNSISPDVGRSVELKGLAVIILGGMGSVPGAVVAGFALGLIEVFTVAHLGSSFRDAVSFAVLFLVLIARPRGLFGRAAAREA